MKWHDGKPFTAKDVKCTWDMLMGKSSDKFRKNPRKAWYEQRQGGHHQRRLRGDVQPEAAAAVAAGAARLGLLAGLSLPRVAGATCARIRSAPARSSSSSSSTNESIKLARNPDYWKKGRPYLDGIEYTIIPNRSTAILAFIAGKFDMTFPTEVTIPLLKDVKAQDAEGDLRGRRRPTSAPT